MQQNFSGAALRRIIDPSQAEVPEHAHAWPVISLFVMGSYINRTEVGERAISAPSAVLYRAGAAHRNTAGPDGFEQIEIEFDPNWLGSVRLPDSPVMCWIGGPAGAHAKRLAQRCGRTLTEAELSKAVRQFIQQSAQPSNRRAATWAGSITQCLRDDPAVRITALANAVDRHPSWLGSAYKRITGEGVQETAARLRVERATRLLRETDLAYSQIALEAGFCDQSHMNRTFRRVLGRAPSAVRDERANLRRL